MSLTIRRATVDDSALILEFIKSLAQYEKLSHEVVATAEDIKKTLFNQQAYAEVLLGFEEKIPVAFALFFHNYSTFLAKPGIHLEDLYVKEAHRGKGYGKAMLSKLAQIAIERDCGRLEWSVLDWNTPAIDFYKRMGALGMDEWTTFRLSGKALLNAAIGSPS
ncbi:MAG TPA: GNAT family N-acetyltransferase [Caldithrix abyssi]|uniref:GNAT family N-acetyltransferase n=1 Tax=Caldithrix abyssi TaxID=187145 RepID=A0A7V5RMY8_CALAY|nr:GNAT family N-acetyltransferase [Caldithrix abyssi]